MLTRQHARAKHNALKRMMKNLTQVGPDHESVVERLHVVAARLWSVTFRGRVIGKSCFGEQCLRILVVVHYHYDLALSSRVLYRLHHCCVVM